MSTSCGERSHQSSGWLKNLNQLGIYQAVGIVYIVVAADADVTIRDDQTNVVSLIGVRRANIKLCP